MYKILIPARLNSQRLKRKLLQEVDYKTIIQMTWEACLKTDAEEVVVVTDSDEIFELINNLGGSIFKSKKEHSSGTDRIQEYVEELKLSDEKLIINVQGDEPFINAKTIKLIINVFKNDFDKSVGIVSVMTPISDDLELNNPNNVKVITDKANNAIYFSRYPIPFKRNINTSVPYKHIGVYAFRKESLLEFSKLNIGDLEKSEKIEALRLIENNIKIKMIISDEMFVGIDTEDDLKKAIKIFSEKDGI